MWELGDILCQQKNYRKNYGFWPVQQNTMFHVPQAAVTGIPVEGKGWETHPLEEYVTAGLQTDVASLY